MEPLCNGHLGPANFDAILLVYRGCPLSEVKLYWHGPVGTTEVVLIEVKCIVSLTQRVLSKRSHCIQLMELYYILGHSYCLLIDIHDKSWPIIGI